MSSSSMSVSSPSVNPSRLCPSGKYETRLTLDRKFSELNLKVTLNALFAGGAEGSQFLLSSIWIVESQVANEVALVTERLAALGALVPLLAGRRGHVVRVVVEVLVPAEELLLPETLVALIALVRLLISVDQHVRLEVALRDGGVGAEVAFEALFSLVSLAVKLKAKKNGCF